MIAFIRKSYIFILGDRILVMRHFESGRRIDAYDVGKNGKLLYQIDLDHFSVGLSRDPGKILSILLVG